MTENATCEFKQRETASPTYESNGIIVKEMEADGHCFFKAISLGVFGTREKFKEVRESVLQEVLKKWEEYQYFIIGDESYQTPVTNIEDYKNLFASEIVLGGNVELSAAASALSICLCVRRSLDDETCSKFGLEDHKKVHLFYKEDGDHGHYDLILEKTDQNSTVDVAEINEAQIKTY